jgi:hypothetical protein
MGANKRVAHAAVSVATLAVTFGYREPTAMQLDSTRALKSKSFALPANRAPSLSHYRRL